MSHSATTIDSPIISNDAMRRIPASAWVISLAIAGLLGFAFRPMFMWMYDRWVVGGSYYSHGFFVPFVALYFVWRDRAALLAERAQGSMIGLAVFLVGLLGLIASGVLTIYFTAGFSFILVLWGLCGFVFGRRVMARLWFPAFVLTFMVPLPLETIQSISLTLKLLASKLGLDLLGLFGIMAVNDGSTIYLGNAAQSTVIVGDACSGLRSLISLIFLGVIIAYISDLTWPRKIVLFLFSMPIAIIANTTRVSLLCLIAYFAGTDAIVGFVHDATGYLIFIVAFLLFYGASTALRWRMRTPAPPPSTPMPPPKAPASTEGTPAHA